MDQRQLIAYYIQRTKEGYSLPEITRDLLARGEDKANIDYVLAAFAEEQAAQRQQSKNPHAPEARKHLSDLEKRYQEEQEARELGKKSKLQKKPDYMLIGGAAVSVAIIAALIFWFIY